MHLTYGEHRASDQNMDQVTLSLTVTFGPTGFEQLYELSDTLGPVAASPYSSMLLYAFHLERREPGACRHLTHGIEGDHHNILRDEYFRRYAEERRVARQARSAPEPTIDLEGMGLL